MYENQSFDEFSAAATRHGYETRNCGNGHWQIKREGVTINFYPFSKRQTVFCPKPYFRFEFLGLNGDFFDAAEPFVLTAIARLKRLHT